MLLCQGEDFKSSSKYNTCSIFVLELMNEWGLLQLLVIINYLVLFIEYAYQTLVVYPMLYRYHPILLLYSVILLLHCIVCVYITHCTHIFNHCNDLALNGSLIGNKHICICIVTLKIFQLYRHYQTYWGRKVQTDNITDWPLNPLTLDRCVRKYEHLRSCQLC
jgi:hypothetical protein